MHALAPSDHAIALPSVAAAVDRFACPAHTHTYHLRGLQASASGEGQEEDDDDIVRWTEFCASVFAYKPNPPPPSYFARHYHNDPRRDPSLVRVLIHCPNVSEEERRGGEIVSSVRIFRRTLSCAGGSDDDARRIEAGGIGEVCTSPDHQRRGLSKILLKNALDIMSSSCREGEEGGMSCSLLHAAPNFRPVYAKVGGYRSVRSEWSVVPVVLSRLLIGREGDGWRVRRAKFPGDASPLRRLHSEYSERRLITVERSLRYWTDYVSAELGESLWALIRPPVDGDGAEDRIVAWISVRVRGDRYQLREFGVDRFGDDPVPTSWAMKRLLGVALKHAAGGNTCASDELSLVLPTFVLSEMRQETTSASEHDAAFLDLDEVKEENDDGWMYVDFDKSRPSVLELTTREANPAPHLIWPTDSF